LYYSYVFETSPARIVLPGQPETGELEAMAMIAANLGNLTGNSLPIDVSLGANLPLTATQQNLLIIGTPDRMPLLSQLKLPVALQQRALSLQSRMPAAITVNQPLTYTLIVQNNTSISQTLRLEDQLLPPPQGATCQQCQQLPAGGFGWDLGVLAPGQIISKVVEVRFDKPLSIGQPIEHTATLFDRTGQVINVDTLTTTVALEPAEIPVSSQTKNARFFTVNNDQAIPETDGVIQIVESPWNSQRAVIAVTGLTEAAVSKAAHALAAQSKFPGMQGQFAIIQDTMPFTTPVSAPQAVDITLAGLGYKDIVRTGRSNTIQLNFTVPRGTSLTEAPYLALHFVHGALLRTISATLEIRLNGLSVTSTELNTNSAADNWIKIDLPAKSLQPGNNRLDLRVAAAWPVCMDEEALARYWITVFSDSWLHLPYGQAENVSVDLADYPRLLADSPGLHDLVVMLPKQIKANNLGNIAKLLSYLGSTSRSDYFIPKVEIINQPSPSQWTGKNILVIGLPTANPYISLVNYALPQPFIPGSNQIQQLRDHVIFRPIPNQQLGYVQLLPVPWDNNKVMLIVTGTNDMGLEWANKALFTDALARQLKGNLAILPRIDQIYTTDTRDSANQPAVEAPSLAAIAPLLSQSDLVTPTAEAKPTNSTTLPESIPTTSPAQPLPTTENTTQGSTSWWLMMVLIVSVVVGVVATGLTIWKSRS
jgi:hypothetical protein